MSITRRTAIEYLAASTAFSAAMPFIGGRAVAQTRDYKIGVVAAMTGPASPFFREYVDAFHVYVREWNKAGGVKGRNAVLDVLDDESGAVQAANGYRRIAGDPETNVAWVAGIGAGGLAIKALAGELKLPIVSGGALDALGLPADPYFFKIAPANSDYLKMFLTWVKAHGMRRVGLLLSNDAYGQGEAQVAKEVMGQLGLEVASLETFSPADTSFSSQLVRVRSSSPDILYVGASGAAGILIYKQIKQFGLRYPLCFMLAAISDAFFQAIGGAANADGLLTPGLIGMLGSNAKGDSGVLYGNLTRALGRPATLANALGWDIGIVTQKAIERSDGSREGVRRELDQIRDLPGIDGPITFTPQNHIGQDPRGMSVLQLAGGKFTYTE